jgi:hypothetical protein
MCASSYQVWSKRAPNGQGDHHTAVVLGASLLASYVKDTIVGIQHALGDRDGDGTGSDVLLGQIGAGQKVAALAVQLGDGSGGFLQFSQAERAVHKARQRSLQLLRCKSSNGACQREGFNHNSGLIGLWPLWRLRRQLWF